MSIRVLFITYEFDDVVNGGIGTAINGLVKNLRARQPSSDFDVLRLEWHPEKPLIIGYFYRGLSEKIKIEINFFELAKLLVNKYRYNIVHFFYHDHQCFALLASRLRGVAGLKIIYSCHSIAKMDVDVRGYQVESISGQLRLLKSADLVHFLNDWCRITVQQQWPDAFIGKAVCVIPNGVNLSDTPAERNKKRDATPKTIACLTRWDFGKGIEILLDAYTIVHSLMPHVDLLLLGRPLKNVSQVPNYLVEIEQTIKGRAPSARVHDWCDQHRVMQLISQADMCVVPSPYETFGYAIYESILSRTPTICADLPCLDGLLQDDVHCLKYAINNAEDLARQMIRLLTDADLYQNLSNADHSNLRNKLAWSSLVEEYLTMYECLDPCR